MDSSEMRKYREAQAWVDESRKLADEAEAIFRSNPNEDTRWNLSDKYSAWRRDLDIRMKRAEQLSDAEYDQLMQERKS